MYKSLILGTALLFTAGQAAAAPQITYDASNGNITLDTDSTDVISFDLQSTAGIFTGDAPDFSGLPAGLTDDLDTQVGWVSGNILTGFVGVTDLGNIAQAGLTEQQLTDDLTTFSYGIGLGAGGGGGDLVINYVPEPSSLALLGLAGVMVARRRR